MLRVSLLVVCWCGFARIGLCRSDSVGLLGMYSGRCVGVCDVLVVFIFWFVVFSTF